MLFWELLALGATPFLGGAEFDSFDLFFDFTCSFGCPVDPKEVRLGAKLPKPPLATAGAIRLMDGCREKNPSDRPVCCFAALFMCSLALVDQSINQLATCVAVFCISQPHSTAS